MRAVWRILLVIPAAFIAASYAAALVIMFGAGAEHFGGEPTGDFAAKLLVIAVIAAMLVGAVAAVPALVMIILAEVFGWRSLILHLAVGIAIGIAAFALDFGGSSDARTDLQLGGGAGAAAGFVYWLIAGRKAGLPRARNGGS